jgi:hypothetical protein
VWAGAIVGLVRLDRVEPAVGFGVVAFATALASRRYEPAVVESRYRIARNEVIPASLAGLRGARVE